MKMLTQLGLIGLAGSFGAICGYLVSLAVGSILPRSFPYGTLLVNLSGCFLIGVILTVLRDRATGDNLRLAIAVGFIGSYTTFSSFIYEIQDLFDAQRYSRGIIYLAVSIAVGLLAVRLGQLSAHMLEAS